MRHGSLVAINRATLILDRGIVHCKELAKVKMRLS